jgi:hypothetical protein
MGTRIWVLDATDGWTRSQAPTHSLPHAMNMHWLALPRHALQTGHKVVPPTKACSLHERGSAMQCLHVLPVDPCIWGGGKLK